MKKDGSDVLLVMAVGLLLWASMAWGATSYHYTNIRFSAPGAESTSINGVNDDGVMVGTFSDANGGTGVFWGTPKKFYRVPVKAYVATAEGINNADEAVGHAFLSLQVDSLSTMFQADGRTVVRQFALDDYVGLSGHAMDLTDDGLIVGVYGSAYTGSSDETCFARLPDGQYWTWLTPFANNCVVSDVTNTWQTGGNYLGVDDHQHGWAATDQWLAIDVPGALATWVEALCPDGRVIGSYVTEDEFVAHGFIRHPSGEWQTLDVPFRGAASTFVKGASPDCRRIVGTWPRVNSDNSVYWQGFEAVITPSVVRR